MHGFSRAVRNGAAAAAVTAALAGTVAAGSTPGRSAPGPAAPGPAPAWCASGGTLSARAMPQRVRIADCDLRGRTVRGANGLAAVVPRDGTSLVAHALSTDGSAELHIDVDERAGEVAIASRGGERVPQGRPRTGRAPRNACQDGTYRSEPARWPKGSLVQWRYHPGTTGRPASAVAAGVANMAGAATDCTSARRYAPPPDVGQRYAGRSAAGPNVTSTATCGSRDRSNTFGWKSMTGARSSVLAATCIWFQGRRIVETDMALQSHGKRWWTSGACTPGSYSAVAVATHEAGHVFGLGHVRGSDHSALTMAPTVASCDNGPATLGWGDYAGLIALYGGRGTGGR